MKQPRCDKRRTHAEDEDVDSKARRAPLPEPRERKARISERIDGRGVERAASKTNQSARFQHLFLREQINGERIGGGLFRRIERTALFKFQDALAGARHLEQERLPVIAAGKARFRLRG